MFETTSHYYWTDMSSFVTHHYIYVCIIHYLDLTLCRWVLTWKITKIISLMQNVKYLEKHFPPKIYYYFFVNHKKWKTYIWDFIINCRPGSKFWTYFSLSFFIYYTTWLVDRLVHCKQLGIIMGYICILYFPHKASCNFPEIQKWS